MVEKMSSVEQPVSRTYEYRKIMKPMLERKRRARINRCLDELKELMLTALQAEGENVSKLEKADILELTVQHLHKLRRQHRLSCNNVNNNNNNNNSSNNNRGTNNNSLPADVDRFRAGFTHCATEVSRCLASTPGVDVQLGSKLMSHLDHRLNEMEKFSPLSIHIGNQHHQHHRSSSSSGISSGTCSPALSSPSSVSSVEFMPLTPPSSRKGSPTSFSEIAMTSNNNNSNIPLTTSLSNRLLTVYSTNVRPKYPPMITVNSATPVWRPW